MMRFVTENCGQTLDHPSRNRSAPDLPALKRSPLFSEEIGIDLGSRKEGEWFRWLLASLLFGARINGTIARNTYRSFLRHGLTTPRRIMEAGWDFLVNPVMREGGYVRYDGRKSEQVLRVCHSLLEEYGGRVSRLHENARDPRDLESRLLGLYGVGPATMNIFLRELRPFWRKADPEPLAPVSELAARLGIDLTRYRRKTLVFARIEAGLIRLIHSHRRSADTRLPRTRGAASDGHASIVRLRSGARHGQTR